MKVLKNKDGFSELSAALVGLMAITCMLVISLTFIKTANQQIVLNEFANQMLEVVCDSGELDSNEVQQRYTQLAQSLKIKPEMTVNASKINASNKVQYGDKITLTLKSEVEINILGFEQTLEFNITKTGRSQVYWK